MSVGQILDLGDGYTVREMRPSDALDMAHHANNTDLARQMRDRFPSPYDEQAAQEWISLSNDKKNWKRTSTQIIDANEPTKTAEGDKLMPESYVITFEDACIGGIGVMFKSDIERRTVEIGYWVGKQFWNRGIATRALTAFAQWTLSTWAYLIRLEAHTYSTNPASGRVLSKAGFSHEGTMRASAYKCGQIIDQHIYVMLRPGLPGVHE